MNVHSNKTHQQVISLWQLGNSVHAIVNETHVSRSTVYRWINNFKAQSKSQPPSQKSVTRLNNKIKRLECIIKIIRESGCTPTAPLKDKLYALESLYGQYSVHMLCEALDVPRGTFYNHIFRNKKDNTWYAKRREELRVAIQKVFDENNQVFGAGKITATFSSYLKSLNVTQSFSRAYVPYDNSVMESFFSSLKREELYRRKFRSENEVRNGYRLSVAVYKKVGIFCFFSFFYERFTVVSKTNSKNSL